MAVLCSFWLQVEAENFPSVCQKLSIIAVPTTVFLKVCICGSLTVYLSVCVFVYLYVQHCLFSHVTV